MSYLQTLYVAYLKLLQRKRCSKMKHASCPNTWWSKQKESIYRFLGLKYQGMPIEYAEVTALGHVVYSTGGALARPLVSSTYRLKVYIDSIYDEPGVSWPDWNTIVCGDTVRVAYRRNRFNPREIGPSWVTAFKPTNQRFIKL